MYEVEYSDGIATVTKGNRTSSVSVDLTAKCYLEGYITRSNIVDVLALAKGYCALKEELENIRC